MSIQRRGVPANRLNKLASASRFNDKREPPLRLGDLVRLNSGGIIMQVVDAIPGDPMIVVGFRLKNGSVMEWAIVREAVHRVRNLW
jgi:hypothetical protein